MIPTETLRHCRVGLHGRNDYQFQEPDYELVRTARIETLKMMSFTSPETFRRLRDENPDIEFIVRLYDERMRHGHHPTPTEFTDKFIPIMEQLRPYAAKFEVHNEPNHRNGIEGWGQKDRHAYDFYRWFLDVYDRLKEACPWASLGFPGLAVPHRDLEWLDICRPAIEKADWLGIHCYWQDPTFTEYNYLSDSWGLRFKSYHEKFTDKPIEITEFGNSNGQNSYPIDPPKIANEYVEYYQQLFKYPYLCSASAFIISAPQSEWQMFTWRYERSGSFKSVVAAVRDMPRPTLATHVVKPVSPAPELNSKLHGAIRNAAWNAHSIAYNPDAAFPSYARQHDLGAPLTAETDVTFDSRVYRLQGYVSGIVFTRVGEWDKTSHIDW